MEPIKFKMPTIQTLMLEQTLMNMDEYINLVFKHKSYSPFPPPLSFYWQYRMNATRDLNIVSLHERGVETEFLVILSR